MACVRTLLLYGSFLWLLLVGGARAAERPEVVWAVVDGPPFHDTLLVQDWSDLGQAPGDLLLRLLSAELPQYDHRLEVISRVKMWRDMQAGRLLCYPDAFKTPERLGWAYFTALAPSPPLAIVARPGRLPPGTALSLRTLLGRADLKPLLEAGRSYGAEIDRLLEAARAPRASVPSSAQLLRMLKRGRMDYLLEYPADLPVYARELGDSAPLDVRMVEEDADPPPTHVACTRGPAGRAVVQDLDTAIRRLSGGQALMQIQQRLYPYAWAPQQKPRLDRFFRERAARSDLE